MTDPEWILKDEPIATSFDRRGYTFYKGGRGVIATPMEASLELVAVKGGARTVIKRVADLQGMVVVDTPEQALEYVRFFTSPETHYLFTDVNFIEPRPVDR